MKQDSSHIGYFYLTIQTNLELYACVFVFASNSVQKSPYINTFMVIVLKYNEITPSTEQGSSKTPSL